MDRHIKGTNNQTDGQTDGQTQFSDFNIDYLWTLSKCLAFTFRVEKGMTVLLDASWKNSIHSIRPDNLKSVSEYLI